MRDTVIFDFKIEASQDQKAHKNLTGWQMYNHFNNNEHITSKSGLTNHLYSDVYTSSEVRVDTFFPRSYDIGDGKQINEFIHDFL